MALAPARFDVLMHIAVSPSSAHAILALLAANVEVETPLNGARTLPACRQFARLRFGGRFLSANG
jgi:hypothetical protein